LIASLDPESPADRVGLPLGGVIVSVDGQRVDSPRDLVRFVQAARPGQSIELTYYQGATRFRKRVQLAPGAARPAAPDAAPAPTPPRSAPTVPTPPPPRPAAPRLSQMLPNTEGRPLLQGIGQLLDEFVPPPGTPPLATNPAQPVPTDRVAELEKQVESLQQQVLQLQQQVAELQKRFDRSPTAER
jgi:hypothetical protein